MPQHDMIISNADGAVSRADINSGFQALASTNSGGSRPATAYSCQLWIDTDTPSGTAWTFNVFDGSDDIKLGIIDASANLFYPFTTAGSASAPAITYHGEPTTGLHFPSAGVMRGTCSGVDTWQADTNGFSVGSNGLINLSSGTTDGVSMSKAGVMTASNNNNPAGGFRRRNSDGSVVNFHRDNNLVGAIQVSSANTAYTTASDYRLKTEVEPLAGALDRLALLKPSRFRWITTPKAPKVDGFLAHEVQGVVPEAVFGEKDAVDDEGNRAIQSLDQAKLVPLLAAAVQELAAKVAALEAAVTALAPVADAPAEAE